MLSLIVLQILLVVMIKWFGFCLADKLCPGNPERAVVVSFVVGISGFAIVVASMLAIAAIIGMNPLVPYVIAVASVLGFVLYSWFKWDTLPVKFFSNRFLSILSLSLSLLAILGASLHDATFMSYDSIQYLIIGETIGANGFFPDPVIGEFYAKRSLYYGLFQGGARLLGVEYFPAFTVVYGVEALFILGWGLAESARVLNVGKRPAIVVGLAATTGLLGSHYIWFQLQYVNHHMMVATHLLTFGVLAWFAIQRKSESEWPLMVLVAAPLVFMRLENSILFPSLVCMYLSTSSLAKSSQTKLMIAVGLTVILANGVLYYLLSGSEGSRFIDPSRIVVLVGMGLAIIAFGIGLKKSGLMWAVWQWILPHFNTLLLGMLVIVVGIGSFVYPDFFATAIVYSLANIVDQTTYDYIWMAVFLIGGCAAVSQRRATPSDTFLLDCILVFVLIVVSLSFARSSSYRVSWADSAGRMMFHIYFLALFFGIVSLWRSMGQTSR